MNLKDLELDYFGIETERTKAVLAAADNLELDYFGIETFYFQLNIIICVILELDYFGIETWAGKWFTVCR